MLTAEGGSLADHAVRFVPPYTLTTHPLNAPKACVAAVPMTASGAEVVWWLVLAQTGLGERSHLLSRNIAIDTFEKSSSN